MANLKQDLLNKLGNEKYYEELELARLAQEPNMYYKEKIDRMGDILKNLASLDVSTQLIGKYFQEPAPTQPEQPKDGSEIKQDGVHPGQTHAE